MTKLSEQISQRAGQFLSMSTSATAIQMLKQAGIADDVARKQVAEHEMMKTACSALVDQGIDFDHALNMVKVATKQVSVPVEKSIEELAYEDLTKVASLVESLESQVAEQEVLLEKIAQLEAELEDFQRNQPVVVSEPLAKIASASELTEDELMAMSVLPDSTLTKLAHMSGSQSPHSLGRPASQATASDPFTEWLNS